MKTQRTIMFAIASLLIVLATMACNKSNSSPSQAFQSYYQAIKNKDIKTLKSLTPKAELEETEKLAKTINKSLDDALKEYVDAIAPELPDKMLEYRNETISSDGKTATLEVKNPEKDSWETLRFVKEDNEWKITHRKDNG